MAIGGIAVGPASAVEIIWETDFAFIHFDWNGTWDNVAWWAYAMWYLDIPDWAYLFAVYGMGWDHIWGPALWGPDGAWGPEDKIDVYVAATGDPSKSSYTRAEWSDPWEVSGSVTWWVNPNDQLDLVGGGWVNQVCTAGRGVAWATTVDMLLNNFFYAWQSGLYVIAEPLA